MPDRDDAELIAELRRLNEAKWLIDEARRRYGLVERWWLPAYAVANADGELGDGWLIARLATALSAARAEALCEAAEIAAQYASDIDDGDYTGIGSDIAGDIAAAILARIQEKNDA